MTEYLHTGEDWIRRVNRRITSLERRKSRLGAGNSWAVATGSTAVAATGITTITWPPGRFTVPPVVQTTAYAVAGGVVSVAFTNEPPTLTSFTVRIYTLGGAQVAGRVMWTATQQTPTSATG